MKKLGFIKEYDNFDFAKSIEQVLNEGIDIDIETQIKVIEYLKNGHIVIAWMEYFVNLEDNMPIAPLMYLTDGEWIWPSYFTYILEKYNHKRVNAHFLSHIVNRNYKIKDIEKNELLKIETDFSQQIAK